MSTTSDLRISTVDELLEVARQLPRHAIACTVPSLPLSLDDRCVIVDSRTLEEHEDVTPEAAALGLTMTIGRRALLGVLDNVAQQKPTANRNELLDALNHYLQRDAFLELPHD